MYHDPSRNPTHGQARTWANDIIHHGGELARESLDGDKETFFHDLLVIAKFIDSLPAIIVDGEDILDLIDSPGDIDASRLEKLIAGPPTLADMDEDERHVYVGTDVHVDGWDSPSLLVSVHRNEAGVLRQGAFNPHPSVEIRPLDAITPVTRPDHYITGMEY